MIFENKRIKNQIIQNNEASSLDMKLTAEKSKSPKLVLSTLKKFEMKSESK